MPRKTPSCSPSRPGTGGADDPAILRVRAGAGTLFYLGLRADWSFFVFYNKGLYTIACD